jgi:type VI secretion system protein ImpJ
MYLGPHEFQAQARYFEDSIHFAASALWLDCYGLTGCTLDADALGNGTVNLVHACGIFPDGTPFHMPLCDATPSARPIADIFPPTRDHLTVSLALPQRRPQGRNLSTAENASDTRFVAEMRRFRDETSDDERLVRLGRKNLKLLLDTEASENYVTLPIARVMRDGSGHFIYDPAFVPPCLQITASERLMMVLRRLIEILSAKSSALSRGQAGRGDFATRDIANFWLLHAVNSGLASLQHLWMAKRGHPLELYMELSRLAGALCTFALDSHPQTLPAYDHVRLGECVDALDRHIREHLELIVPTNCISIPLTKIADYFYDADITDARCLGRARWIFGIHSPIGEAELIGRTPLLVKVCSAKFVGELVKRAMGGLALTHLPVPPSAIPAKVESHYFSISRDGPFWDHIVQTKRVGIYVPGDLPNVELELLVVLDSK